MKLLMEKATYWQASRLRIDKSSDKSSDSEIFKSKSGFLFETYETILMF